MSDHLPNENYLQVAKGLKSWLTTVDHKRIGLMYLCAVALFFFVGGLFAMVIRLELFYPLKDFLTADQYNEVFTLHGIVMIFLFIIPAIPAALGNFILPLQIGAKDLALPKINLFSFYLYCLGAVIALWAIISGHVDTGWTFYAPYSISKNPAVLWMVTGAFILGMSSILTGLNFIVTIHTMRAPGMTWFKMPLFVWASYATSIIQIFATPVLAITLILLLIENFLRIGIFDPALGGDPLLFEHFFWFYSHPAVYIIIVPAFGIMSEIFPTFSRRDIFGYKFIAFSSIAIALIGFLVWGHHMFVAGESGLADAIFSFLTFFTAVPSAVKVFNWTTTLYKGSIQVKSPMLWALMFLFNFTIGGLTGIILAILSLDIQLHDTYFVVAHFHYVAMGSAAVAFIAGLHYWWPKMTGKVYSEFWANTCAILFTVGFHLTFVPQFIMGLQGMPRRFYSYLPQFTIYHQLSTVGTVLVGLGLGGIVIYLLASLRNGKDAGKNPWGGKTLEWEAESPPVLYNFKTTPIVTKGPYAYD